MSVWDDDRAAWGARPGRSMYTEQASRRTVFMEHHVGDSPLGLASKSHDACLRQVKSFQDFHMGPQRGWSDIGYNGLVCQHGRAIEGRGLAFVGAHCPGYNRYGWGLQFMTGGSEEPTEAAKTRMVKLKGQLSAQAGHSLKVLGHSDGYPTECPGGHILSWIRAGMPLQGGGTQSVPYTKPKLPSGKGKIAVDGILGPNTFKLLQKRVGAVPDGLWGPATRRAFQRFLRVKVDGDFGVRSVKALQRWVGVTVDGIWGTGTTRGLQQALNSGKARPKARLRDKVKPKSSSTRLLKLGSSGTRVRSLQRGMNATFPAYSKLVTDGKYGPATQRVVREFQRRVGLPVDGIVGANTRAKLANYGVKA